MSDEIKLTGFTNRTEFPDGPWDDEPDLCIWQEPETGYLCAITRPRLGTLAGYVAVPNDHPLHGVNYVEYTDNLSRIDVHCGLTYSAPTPYIAHGVPIADIASIKFDGASNWWFGFDCAHSGDLSPGLSGFEPMPGEEYRDIDYVRSETVNLARQLWEIAND